MEEVTSNHIRNVGIFKKPQTKRHKGNSLIWAILRPVFSTFGQAQKEALKHTPLLPSSLHILKIQCAKYLPSHWKVSSEKQYPSWQAEKCYLLFFVCLLILFCSSYCLSNWDGRSTKYSSKDKNFSKRPDSTYLRERYNSSSSSTHHSFPPFTVSRTGQQVMTTSLSTSDFCSHF